MTTLNESGVVLHDVLTLTIVDTDSELTNCRNMNVLVLIVGSSGSVWMSSDCSNVLQSIIWLQIFAMTRGGQFCHLLYLLSTKFLSHVNDCIEDIYMVTILSCVGGYVFHPTFFCAAKQLCSFSDWFPSRPTGVNISFSQSEYTVSESDSTFQVQLNKNKRLANPLEVVVTALTLEEAYLQGYLPLNNSLKQAGE